MALAATSSAVFSKGLVATIATAVVVATAVSAHFQPVPCPSAGIEGRYGTVPETWKQYITYDTVNEYGNIPLVNRTWLNGTHSGMEKEVIEKDFTWPIWDDAFWTTMLATAKVANDWLNATTIPNREITNLTQYNQLYRYFMEHYGDGVPQPQGGPVMLKKGIGYDPDLSAGKWNDDNVFGQERLMGNNPVQLQRVVPAPTPVTTPAAGMPWTELETKLNADYLNQKKFDQAVQHALADETTSLQKVMGEGRLFVLYYPLLAKIVGDPASSGAYNNRSMMAPIALFVATKNESYPLKPVAIQLGHTPTSAVHTPHESSFFWWTVAKRYINNADGLTSQIVHHLVNTHLVSEAFAVAMLRQLPELHPVYQILKFHFEGLIAINTEGFNILTPASGSVSRIAGFGHHGLIALIKAGYEDWNYDKMDFKRDLKTRGVDDVEGLPKYPFRDDGELVYDVIEGCVEEYVDYYYCSSADIQNDVALQSYVAEVAEKHKGKGINPTMTTTDELKTMLKRIIYVNSVHHAAVNYAVREFGSSVLTIPFAVYKRPEQMEHLASVVTPDNTAPLVQFFGNFSQASLQAETATQLASLRYSDLFDYGHKMEHASDEIKKKFYGKFRPLLVGSSTSVQTVIDQRNKQRKGRNVLQYAYMQPKTLPNSIAI